MAFIKISDAFKAGADWISATVRALMRDQQLTCVDTVQDVRDNDFEQTRFLYVRANNALYRLNLSSTAADDGDQVLRDNIGRRYEKQGGITAIREKLTANRTYYVRTDGSDSNTGLVDSAGGALLTLQAAWNKVAALDLSTFSVTIDVGDGTYTAGIAATSMPIGGSGITLLGNAGTPANVHLDMTTTCISISAPLPCAMTIQGFKFTFAGASVSAVALNSPGTVTVTNIELAGGSTGFAGAYYAGVGGARLIVSTGQLISAGMSCFTQVIRGGIIQFFSITVTLTGTPAFSWVTASATTGGIIDVVSVTFSGSATGTRYATATAGGINTGGGGASYIPGNSAGSATSPGWYV